MGAGDNVLKVDPDGTGLLKAQLSFEMTGKNLKCAYYSLVECFESHTMADPQTAGVEELCLEYLVGVEVMVVGSHSSVLDLRWHVEDPGCCKKYELWLTGGQLKVHLNLPSLFLCTQHFCSSTKRH